MAKWALTSKNLRSFLINLSMNCHHFRHNLIVKQTEVLILFNCCCRTVEVKTIERTMLLSHMHIVDPLLCENTDWATRTHSLFLSLYTLFCVPSTHASDTEEVWVGLIVKLYFA